MKRLLLVLTIAFSWNGIVSPLTDQEIARSHTIIQQMLPRALPLFNHLMLALTKAYECELSDFTLTTFVYSLEKMLATPALIGDSSELRAHFPPIAHALITEFKPKQDELEVIIIKAFDQSCSAHELCVLIPGFIAQVREAGMLTKQPWSKELLIGVAHSIIEAAQQNQSESGRNFIKTMQRIIDDLNEQSTEKSISSSSGQPTNQQTSTPITSKKVIPANLQHAQIIDIADDHASRPVLISVLLATAAHKQLPEEPRRTFAAALIYWATRGYDIALNDLPQVADEVEQPWLRSADATAFLLHFMHPLLPHRFQQQLPNEMQEELRSSAIATRTLIDADNMITTPDEKQFFSLLGLRIALSDAQQQFIV